MERPRRVSAQPEQRLHPQPELELEFESEVPPTLPHEPQPHRRQHPQPVDAPPTEPELPQLQRLQPLPVDVDVPATVPLCCVQVQVQVQVGFVVEAPPTEPVVCLQQGLQHRCWTKSGNVRPLKQPLQEEAILYPLQKMIRERLFPRHSMPHVPEPCRSASKNRKNPDGTGPSGSWIQKSKETQRLENCGARRAAFKPYF